MIYPRTLFKESFGKFNDKELWAAYLEKKGKILDETADVWLSTGEAGKVAKVHYCTIQQWAKKKLIKSRRAGRYIKVLKSSLLDYIKQLGY